MDEGGVVYVEWGNSKYVVLWYSPENFLHKHYTSYTERNFFLKFFFFFKFFLKFFSFVKVFFLNLQNLTQVNVITY